MNPSQRTGGEQPVPDTDFTAAILETEVVVKDATNGHSFYFPILGNGR